MLSTNVLPVNRTIHLLSLANNGGCSYTEIYVANAVTSRKMRPTFKRTYEE